MGMVPTSAMIFRLVHQALCLPHSAASAHFSLLPGRGSDQLLRTEGHYSGEYTAGIDTEVQAAASIQTAGL